MKEASRYSYSCGSYTCFLRENATDFMNIDDEDEREYHSDGWEKGHLQA